MGLQALYHSRVHIVLLTGDFSKFQKLCRRDIIYCSGLVEPSIISFFFAPSLVVYIVT